MMQANHYLKFCGFVGCMALLCLLRCNAYGDSINIEQPSVLKYNPNEPTSSKADKASENPGRAMIMTQLRACREQKHIEHQKIQVPSSPPDQSLRGRNPLADALSAESGGSFDRQVAPLVKTFDTTTHPDDNFYQKNPQAAEPTPIATVLPRITMIIEIDRSGQVTNAMVDPSQEKAKSWNPKLNDAAKIGLGLIKDCAPFKGLPADRYEEWKKIVVPYFP